MLPLKLWIHFLSPIVGFGFSYLGLRRIVRLPWAHCVFVLVGTSAVASLALPYAGAVVGTFIAGLPVMLVWAWILERFQQRLWVLMFLTPGVPLIMTLVDREAVLNHTGGAGLALLGVIPALVLALWTRTISNERMREELGVPGGVA